MKIACMTTMHKPYFDHIGDIMLESFGRYWPTDIELFVFQEDFEIPNYDRITGLDWNEHCKSRWESFRGKASNTAETFAKKGFAFLAGMKIIDCDLLIWIDSDLLTYKPFPREKLETILPKKKLIGVFDTLYQVMPNYTQEQYCDKTRVLTACESGFVLINKRHKNFKDLVSNYEKNYSLESRPKELGDWYDTNVLMASLIDMRSEVEDLSKLRTTNKTQTPINRSWIGEYVHHAKGKAKRQKDKSEYKKGMGL